MSEKTPHDIFPEFLTTIRPDSKRIAFIGGSIMMGLIKGVLGRPVCRIVPVDMREAFWYSRKKRLSWCLRR
jgi:hypothetical protein